MKRFHPCSKEFQEEAKRLGLTGNQLIQKLIEEGKLPDPTKIEKNRRNDFLKKKGHHRIVDYRNTVAKKKGYGSEADRQRERSYNRRDTSPMIENEDLAQYLGIYIGEDIADMILIDIFGSIEKKMANNYPGYDRIVRGGYKIDIKTAQLRSNRWQFRIENNDKTDYFLLLSFDENLELLHVWLIEKNEIVRKVIGGSGKSIRMEKFYRRETINIYNNLESMMHFKYFEKYDWIGRLRCLIDVQDKLKKLRCE